MIEIRHLLRSVVAATLVWKEQQPAKVYKETTTTM